MPTATPTVAPTVVTSFACFEASGDDLRQAATDYVAGNNVAAIEAEYGPIEGWCVGAVTDFSDVFNGADSFNQDISAWDVSSAVNMDSMFNSASAVRNFFPLRSLFEST